MPWTSSCSPGAFTSAGDAPAGEVLPRLLQRDAKRLRRAVKAIAGAETGQERDLALHEARKKAKRLRYAAESTVPVLGKRPSDWPRRSRRSSRHWAPTRTR